MSTATATNGNPHPYYPAKVEIPGYSPNQDSIFTALVFFTSGLIAILGTSLEIANYVLPSMTREDKFALLWFVLSGSLHCFFEGYFVTHHTRMGSSQDILAQLWKEYALSDSRYLTSNAFVVSIETITVFVWGPLCLLIAYFIIVRHPLRYPLQAIVSVAHIYGDLLYYFTSMFDHFYNGLPYSRPEALYFWGYYVFMNFIWIVVPLYHLHQSLSASLKAFKALNGAAGQYKLD